MPSRIPSGLNIEDTLHFVIDAGDWVWIKGERGPLSKENGEYIFGQRRFALPDVESVHQGLDENIPDNLSIYLIRTCKRRIDSDYDSGPRLSRGG